MALHVAPGHLLGRDGGSFQKVTINPYTNAVC
jgi:hypothetical protein